MIDEAGLLVKPQLLRHMESILKEVTVAKEELKTLKEENDRMKKSIKVIKMHIADERATGAGVPYIPTDLEKKETGEDDTKKVYTGRPTLVIPELPPLNRIKKLKESLHKM